MRCSTSPKPSRQLNCFQGPSTVKRKRKLFPEPAPASPSSWPLPSTPTTGSVILGSPFALENCKCFWNCTIYMSWIDSPIQALFEGLMEPFCHFGLLQSSHLNICFKNHDLHLRRISTRFTIQALPPVFHPLTHPASICQTVDLIIGIISGIQFLGWLVNSTGEFINTPSWSGCWLPWPPFPLLWMKLTI